MADEVLKATDVAREMHCSVRTVAALCEKAEAARLAGESTVGMLVGFRAGVGEKAPWRVTRRALDHYMGVDALITAGVAS